MCEVSGCWCMYSEDKDDCFVDEHYSKLLFYALIIILKEQEANEKKVC